jgi:hypothetical protein
LTRHFVLRLFSGERGELSLLGKKDLFEVEKEKGKELCWVSGFVVFSAGLLAWLSVELLS